MRIFEWISLEGPNHPKLVIWIIPFVHENCLDGEGQTCNNYFHPKPQPKLLYYYFCIQFCIYGKWFDLFQWRENI